LKNTNYEVFAKEFIQSFSSVNLSVNWWFIEVFTKLVQKLTNIYTHLIT